MHAILAVKVHSLFSHCILVSDMQGFILYVDVGVEAKLFPRALMMAGISSWFGFFAVLPQTIPQVASLKTASEIPADAELWGQLKPLVTAWQGCSHPHSLYMCSRVPHRDSRHLHAAFAQLCGRHSQFCTTAALSFALREARLWDRRRWGTKSLCGL